jgi:transposase
MYYNSEVQIPMVKGKIITKKKGPAVYILYQYGTDYNSVKQYSVPKRIIIGKQVPNDPNRMYPNDRYQEFFPDAVLPEERPEADRSCCLRIGSYIVIRYVLEEYQLPKILFKRLGTSAGLFLDLAAFSIIDQDNAGQYYPDFAFCHPLFSDRMKVYSDSAVSRLLSSIGRDQIIGFLDDWNAGRDKKQRIYVSYDSTNKNCQAGDIDLVEFGKAKDDKGVPVFNVSVAFDKSNRVPLFYEEYPGSITDVSQFRCMVDKAIEYDYKKIGFILDRGYFSKENIHYSFIIMAKGCKSLVSAMVDSVRNTFETDRKCAIRAYKVYGMTITSRLYEDDTDNRYFHIFYNPSKQAAERERLEQGVDSMHQFLEKHIGTDTKFGPAYNHYFSLYYKGEKLVGIQERSDVIQKELDLCGYFCIITSEKMTAFQALIQYKGRDISEKLFRADKTFLGDQSMRVQSEEALSSKVFIEFVALIVRNRIYNLLKETMLKIESSPNYMTVPAALRELEKIEMVRRNSGSYALDHAVTKKQKIILSAFGLNEDSIRAGAAEISSLLSSNQSLMNKSKEA